MVVLGVYALLPASFGRRQGQSRPTRGQAPTDMAVEDLLAQVLELKSRVAGLEEEVRAMRLMLDSAGDNPTQLRRAA